jgi:hypothetical protein
MMLPVHVHSRRQFPTPNRTSVSENVDCHTIQSYILLLLLWNIKIKKIIMNGAKYNIGVRG